jgi:hypothetical protein
MTIVDLEFIGNDPLHRRSAIKWLNDSYGLPAYDSWYVMGLQYVYFKEPKHATHFILKWS